ncbi:retrovirus-related pol polyprotein from transposon TNT 1-94 [Tanacetum coccineum]
MVEVKVLMALAEDNKAVSKEGARNGEWIKISIRKFDGKRGTIFNSNKEVVMIAPRVRDVYVLDMTSSAQESCLFCQSSEPVTPRSINHEKYTLVIVDEYSRNNILINFCDEKGISQNFSSSYTPEQSGVAERKNRTLIEAARTMH